MGGSKVFAEKAPSNGRQVCATFALGQMVTHPAADFWPAVRSLVGARRRRRRCRIVRTNVGTADQKSSGRLHYHSATAKSVTVCSLHCLDPCLPLTKNPNCVFLSD